MKLRIGLLVTVLAITVTGASSFAKDDAAPQSTAPASAQVVPGGKDVWNQSVFSPNMAIRHRMANDPNFRQFVAAEPVVAYPPESAGLGRVPSYGYMNRTTKQITWISGPATAVETTPLPTAAAPAKPAPQVDAAPPANAVKPVAAPKENAAPVEVAPPADSAKPTESTKPAPRSSSTFQANRLEVIPNLKSEFGGPVYRASLSVRTRLTYDPAFAKFRALEPVMAYQNNPKQSAEMNTIVGFYDAKTGKVNWINGLEHQRSMLAELNHQIANQGRVAEAAAEAERLAALKATSIPKSNALTVTNGATVDHLDGRRFDRVLPHPDYEVPKEPTRLGLLKNKVAGQIDGHLKTYAPGVNKVRVSVREMYNKALEVPPSVWNNVKAIPAMERELLREFRENPFHASPFVRDAKNPGFGNNKLEGAPKYFRDAQKALQTKNTAADNVNGSMNNLSTQAVVYGIMLGISAYTKLTLDYPNNPTAWEEFRQTVTDPIGVLSLVGFVMAYNSAYSKLGGGAGKAFWSVSGAMAAGTLASYSINYFASNPEVMKCGGFTAYRETGHFVRDMEACDRAFSTGNLMDIASQTVKASLAQAAVGTAIYAGIQVLWPYLGRLIYTPANIPRFGSLSPLIITGLIMWYASEVPVQVITSQMNEAGAKYEILNSGTYAKSLNRAEDDLLNSWMRAKTSGWADPSDLSGTKNVCYDAGRVGSPYYDCDQPNADFQGALDTYQNQMASWRSYMMQPTMQSFQKWMTKVTGFRQMMAASHQFYKGAIEKILYTRRHPTAPATDPKVFNAVNMGLDLKPKPRAPFVISKDGSWSRVYTPELSDYLMTSLACGPEAEGREKRTILGHVGRFWSEWVTTHASPDDMIDDVKGWNTVFRPPRLTSPLYDTTDTVCDNVSQPFGSDQFWKWIPTSIWTPMDRLTAPMKASVDSFFVRAHGKNYKGLPAYIADNIRPGVISLEGNDRFDTWWNDYVETRNQEFEAYTKHQYRKMLVKRLQPTLVSNDYDWCQAKAVVANSNLERYLGELGDVSQACGPKQTHRLARGIINNFRDEARLYFAMMMDLYVSNPSTFRGANDRSVGPNQVVYLENVVRVPAQRVLRALAKFEKVFSGLGDPKEVKAAYEEVKTEYGAFVDLMIPEGLTLDPTDQKAQYQYEWMLKLLNAITADLGGLEAYMQYVTMGAQSDLT